MSAPSSGRPLPVIAIDDIRAAVLPSQVLNRDPPISGLHVGGANDFVPFDFNDEDDVLPTHPVERENGRADPEKAAATNVSTNALHENGERDQDETIEPSNSKAQQDEVEPMDNDESEAQEGDEVCDNSDEQATQTDLSEAGASASSRARGAKKNEEAWNEKFQLLVDYKRVHGDTRVPVYFMDKSTGIKLGNWVTSQRTAYSMKLKGQQSALDDHRVEKLDSIGFQWPRPKSLGEKAFGWQDWFGLLVEYKNEHGDTLVPATYVHPASGRGLGSWVAEQRKCYSSKNTVELSESQREKLNSIGFEVDLKMVEPIAKKGTFQWKDWFRILVEYKTKHGNTLVPATYIDPSSGMKLGVWIKNQRSYYSAKQRGRSTSLSDERVEKLNSIGFEWVAAPGRAPLSPPWEVYYRALVEYKERHGDTRVPFAFVDPSSGLKLGEWAKKQRNYYARNHNGLSSSLHQVRLEKLNRIDFESSVTRGTEGNSIEEIRASSTTPRDDASSSGSSVSSDDILLSDMVKNRPAPTQQESCAVAPNSKQNHQGHVDDVQEQDGNDESLANNVVSVATAIQTAPCAQVVASARSEEDEVLAQLEKDILQKLDDDITALEEREILERLDWSISKAEELDAFSETIGGKVGYSYEDSPWCCTLARAEPATTVVSQGTIHSLPLDRAMMLLPKRYEGLIFSREDFYRDVVNPFETYLKSQELERSVRYAVSFHCAPDDTDSWQVVVEGHQATVESFRQCLNVWMKGRVADFNASGIANNGIRIELELDCSQPLGMELLKVGSTLYASVCDADGQLAKALGPCCTDAGAILMSANGITCGSMEEFQTIKNGCGGGPFRIILGLSNSADLSEVNDEYLVSRASLQANLEAHDSRALVDSGSASIDETSAEEEFVSPDQGEAGLFKNGASVDATALAATNLAGAFNDGPQIEVAIDSSRPVGATLKEINSQLSIQINDEGGQLAKALGPRATDAGAFVLLVQGLPCKDIEHFKRVKAELQGRRLTLLLKLCEGADLSAFNSDCVVNGPRLAAIRKEPADTTYKGIAEAPITSKSQAELQASVSRSDSNGWSEARTEVSEQSAPAITPRNAERSSSPAISVELTAPSDPLPEALTTTRPLHRKEQGQFSGPSKIDGGAILKIRRPTETEAHEPVKRIQSSSPGLEQRLEHSAPCVSTTEEQLASTQDSSQGIASVVPSVPRTETHLASKRKIFSLGRLPEHVPVRPTESQQALKKRRSSLGSEQNPSSVSQIEKAPATKKRRPSQSKAFSAESESQQRIEEWRPSKRRNSDSGAKGQLGVSSHPPGGKTARRGVFSASTGLEAPISRKKPPSSSSIPSLSQPITRTISITNVAQGSQLEDAVIPRKQRPDDSVPRSSMIHPSKPKSSRSKSSPNPPRPTIEDRGCYHVQFKTDDALGFYAYSKIVNSTCAVLSVCPRGQATKDTRIQANATIVATSENASKENHQRVSDHNGLRRHFEEAHKKGLDSLFLWFVNRGVIDAQRYDGSVLANNDWTSKGLWRGHYRYGWDGRHNFIYEAPQGVAESEGSQVETPAFSASVHGNTQAIEGGEVDAWTEVSGMRPLLTKEYRPESILATDKEAKVGRKLRFSDAIEERRYAIGSLTHEFQVMSTSGAVSNPFQDMYDLSPPSSFNAMDELFDAVTNRKVDDVVQLIENGVLAQVTSEVEIESRRKALKGASKSRRQDAQSQELTDKTRKDRLLKMCINACSVARKATTLKCWEEFELEIVQIYNLRTLPPAQESPSSRVHVDVGIQFDVKNRKHWSLPKLNVNPTLSYPRNAFQRNLHFNTRTTQDRSISLDIKLQNGNRVNTLGSASIAMSQIHQECSTQGEWTAIEFEAAPTAFLARATVVLNARKRKDSEPSLKNYVEAQCTGARSALNELVTTIKRFNAEAGENGWCKVSADIRTCDNITPLHSAILLRDEQLTGNLLELGADPLVESGIGTAMSLAQKAAYALQEGRRDSAEASTGSTVEVNDTDQRRIQNHRARFQKIAKLLRERVKSAVETPLEETEDPADQVERGAVFEGPERQIESVDSNLTTGADLVNKDQAMIGPGDADVIVTARVKLPVLPETDWIKWRRDGCDPCRKWESDHKCSFRQGCMFVHRQRLWHGQLQAIWDGMNPNDRKLPMLPGKVLPKKDGRWFTAGYTSCFGRTKAQHVIYAEGGDGSLLSEQGIYWYESEDDAKRALMRAILVSMYAMKKQIVPESTSATATAIATTKVEDSASRVNNGANDTDSLTAPRKAPAIDKAVPAITGASRLTNTPENSEVASSLPPTVNKASSKKLEEMQTESLDVPATLSAPPSDACLPSISRIELVRKLFGRGECNSFPQDRGCPHGSHCRYIHIAKSIGKIQESVRRLKVAEEQVAGANAFRLECDGHSWYTMWYQDPRDKTVFLAEQEAGRTSTSGIWWYHTEKDAKLALRLVVGIVKTRQSALQVAAKAKKRWRR